MKKVTVISRAIPTKPRSENYPVGSTVVRTGGGSGGGNTTVVTGSAALEAEITSNAAKTGHIEAGQVLPKGMTFTQFVKALLFKPTPATLEGRLTTGNDVEYGTSKGQINYTATRHGNGEMTKSFYENDESNKLEFSTEVNGVQTAMRALSGIYTQGETYKATVVYAASDDESIPETTLNNSITVNVRRKWFAGVVSAIPATSAQVRALNNSGLYTGAGTYKFEASNWKMIAICFPEGDITSLEFAEYPGNLILDKGLVSGPTEILVEGLNGSSAIRYKMWIMKTATINDTTNHATLKIS